MNYKEHVYKTALEIVGDIYHKSQYSNDYVDFYRIYDVINSVNDNQFASKQWLIHESKKFLSDKQNIFIAGSWYGLTGLLLSEIVSKTSTIYLCDMDLVCKDYAKKICDPKFFDNFQHVLHDAVDYFIEKSNLFDCLINTSCEHMEKADVQLMVGLKDPETLVVMQSNNYHEVDSHINTSNSLEEFVDYLKLSEVYYQGTLSRNNYDRYMVIGK